jgi:hypothetical protein
MSIPKEIRLWVTEDGKTGRYIASVADSLPLIYFSPCILKSKSPSLPATTT